jgi:exodeoxyribonuclease VII small subunit
LPFSLGNGAESGLNPRCKQECFDISGKSKLNESLAPVESLSFEAALKELEEIVSKLEQGEVDLEDSIVLYERGQGLKVHCEKKLKAAEGRLEKVVQTGAGATSEPLDIG